MRATPLEEGRNLPASWRRASACRRGLRQGSRLENYKASAIRRNTGISITVNRLKQIVWRFCDRCAGLVPGGRPLLNTATDSGDSNPELRTKFPQVLGSWLHRLQSIAEEGQRRGEVRSDVCRHLEDYLDTDIPAKGFAVRAGGL
jgi:hypothetical protein